MSDELPSIQQISAAGPHIDAAARATLMFDLCAGYLPPTQVLVMQRLYHSYISSAARALGFDLVPAGLHVVESSDGPNTMREVQ